MLHNVNISTRGITAFVSLVVLAGIVAGFSIHRVSGLQTSLAMINEFNSVKQR